MNQTRIMPGDIVALCGVRFVVLDISEDRNTMLILAVNTIGDCEYGDIADYGESLLREYTESWFDDLDAGLRKCVRARRLGQMSGVKAAPLTLAEAKRYRDLIPDCNADSWLVTELGMPECFGDTFAMVLRAHGGWTTGYCNDNHGIRPALLVSLGIANFIALYPE